ncbi:uncharacterized protein LOC112459940 [Temnothorax curvispinosus]|uniref:Uncharacterized protein LOC112459940 n=1 Tax=Temnothorax curvispinosus TaxID=300111 RepID=A0A6J1QCR2_9HYME|nr:uncharacterized protein LOC112459940 [Temnothorax curvispinosus]
MNQLRIGESEKRYGLASVFAIKCHNCLCIKKVHTSNRTAVEKGRSLYEINAAVALDSAASVVDVTVSYDFGWQKRGNGRTYDSKSGQGSVGGLRSKKLLAYSVKSTCCAMCRKGHSPDSHKCTKNWSGSAKSMEADTAVQLMVKNPDFKKAGIRIGTLIGDEDSSTIAAVQRETSHRVVKWSDSNHQLVCGTWCEAKDNPEYVFKSLPKGKPLFSKSLQTALYGVLMEFTSRVLKVAPGGSSQLNESFNHMVATRAPKSKHYASSRSILLRVAAAVCQKNFGAKHIIDVRVEAGLPPGTIAEEYCLRREVLQRAIAVKRTTLEAKRRRCYLKNKRQRITIARESREGITYQSGMGLDLPIETTCEIDEPLREDSPQVIVDIETTGLASTADFVQIAAKCGDQEFARYMLPSQSINCHAADKTGLSVVGGELHHYNKIVTTIPPREVGKEFIRFLGECGQQVLLLGHNIVRFDAPRIMRWLQGLGLLESFVKGVYGVCDTIPLIGQGKVKKQEELAKLYLKGEEWERIIAGSYNALTDCQILYGLLAHFKVSDTAITAGALRLQTLLQRQAIAKKKAQFLETLQCLRDHISKNMMSKIAAAGINMNSLCDAFNRSGADGVKLCLAVSVNGKPRVTSNKKIIDKVIDFLASSNEERGMEVLPKDIHRSMLDNCLPAAGQPFLR